MRFARKGFFVVIALLTMASLVTAQDACPADVDDAIAALNDICFSTGRNQACYGNGDIVTVPVADATIDFAVPGDSANINDIDSMILSPFEVGFSEWGVAVLVLQADLPDTLPGQNVTMLLLGETSFANDNGAYYFTSGIGQPGCNQAPNGMLIQTPDGIGEVNFTVNGIDISLGSTAYLGTLEEDMLTFALLEGNATLSIDDSEVELEGEQFTTVALDEDGNATGEFSEADDIEELELPELPITLLPESIDENSSSTVSGDAIIPASGEWLSTINLFNFADDCPAMFNETMARQMLGSFGVEDQSTQQFSFDSNEFNINDLFNIEAFASSGLDATYSNPETNVHMVTFLIPEGGGSFNYIWRIMSEDRMEGEIVQDIIIPELGDCTITTTFLLERQS